MLKRDDKPLRCGVRQVGATLDDIEYRHQCRYEWPATFGSLGSVLDVGCGCGYGSAILGASEYFGLDHSPEAVAYAIEHYVAPGRAFACREAHDVPRGPFDAVTAFEVLEHLAEPEKSLSAWCGALRAGGRVFLSVPSLRISTAAKH